MVFRRLPTPRPSEGTSPLTCRLSVTFTWAFTPIGGAVTAAVFRAHVLCAIAVVPQIPLGVGCDWSSAAPTDRAARQDYGLPMLADLLVAVSVAAGVGAAVGGHGSLGPIP